MFTYSTHKFQMLASLVLAGGMALTVGTALAFEKIGGYLPCKLCLEQRVPYYIGIPVMLLAFLAAVFKLPPLVIRGLILFGGLLMLWGIGLSGFHAGVEWAWWPGPTDCASPITTTTGNLFDQLNAIIPPSCSEASWRFLGLSFAGWNFIVSIVLAGMAFGAALKR